MRAPTTENATVREAIVTIASPTKISPIVRPLRAASSRLPADRATHSKQINQASQGETRTANPRRPPRGRTSGCRSKR